MRVLCLFVVYVILFINDYGSAYKETMYEGTACVVEEKPGICRSLDKCPEEKERVKKDGRARVQCSFSGHHQIVCCEVREVTNPKDLFFDKRSGTNELPVCTFNGELPLRCCPSRQVYTPPLEGEGCPQLPRLQKTGNFVKDKCWEYSTFARPCVQQRSGAFERASVCTIEQLGERITNGVKAVFAEFPHMVLLGYQLPDSPNREVTWMNGGTLISETFVLTAAHAVFISREGTAVTQVCVGLLKSSKACPEQTLYRVKNSIQHDGYEFAKFYDDIALLELEKPVILNQYVRPACLPFTTYDKPIPSMIVAGWGYTSATATVIADDLYKTTVMEFNTSLCKTYIANKPRWDRGWLEDKLLCAGSDDTSDSCRGDSGGPLMVKAPKVMLGDCSYELVGVVSAGVYTCGKPGQAAVYTRVSGYIDWVVSRVWPDKVKK